MREPKRKRTALTVLAATMTVLGTAVPQAHAEQVVSCGEVVSGTVTVANDLVCSETDGLIVGADDTVIDLNGHRITCTGVGYRGSCQGGAAAVSPHPGDLDPENGVGIEGYLNVRVFDSKGEGAIDGFDNGVQSTSSGAVTIEGLKITGPPATLSPRPPSHGIAIYGSPCTNPSRIGTGPDAGNDVSNHNQGIAVTSECVELAYNELHHNNSTGPLPSNGILLHSGDKNVVHHNTVVHNGDEVNADPLGVDGGITLRSGSGLNQIANNVVNDNLGDGISVRNLSGDDSPANTIASNTMLRNGGNSAEIPAFDAAQRAGGPANEWNPDNVCVTQNEDVPPGVCGPTEGPPGGGGKPGGGAGKPSGGGQKPAGQGTPSKAPPPAPTCQGRRATIVASAGNDRIKGTKGNDVIVTGAGNDVIVTGAGNDVICAGAGNDRVLGGTGDDVVHGNEGKDRLGGQSGRDRISGHAGNDTVNGEAGNDRLAGNSGKDRMSGGTGNDRLSGGSGRDRLRGGSGDDILSGNAGRDTLLGDPGRDRLSGNSGNDRLFGGPGRDRMSGGSGRDKGKQ